MKVHCIQSALLFLSHAVYRYVKETLCLSLCINMGTSILAACVTTGVLECDRTLPVVLNQCCCSCADALSKSPSWGQDGIYIAIVLLLGLNLLSGKSK